MNNNVLKEKEYLYAANYEFLKSVCNKNEGDWSDFCTEFNDASEENFSGFLRTRSDVATIVGESNIFKIQSLYRKIGYQYADLNPIYPVKNDDKFLKDFMVGASTQEEIAEKSRLDKCYLGKISAEFEHITDQDRYNWLVENFEKPIKISKEEQKRNLIDLMEAQGLENFLHTKFPGAKRFSAEGGEVSITIFENFMNRASHFGADEIVIGMAHRGRLNFLTKVCREEYGFLFGLFRGKSAFDSNLGLSGDVKYHLGASCDRDVNGKKVHLSMLPNPSHLEAVNPVVLGSVRAKQDERDQTRKKIIPFLIHGDASFVGQGIIYETFVMKNLPAYDVGGVIHLIIDNQVGFTASNAETCSLNKASEIGKIVGVPILHVNGDDPESAGFAAKFAAEYRDKFGADILINMICYRRWGHNEGDEPNFTQPSMYKIISGHKTTFELYADKLISAGVVTTEEVEKLKSDFHSFLDSQMDKFEPKKLEDLCRSRWSKGMFHFDDSKIEEVSTGIEKKIVPSLIDCLNSMPEGFVLNSKIKKLLEGRVQMLESGKSLDWGTGEMLGFASILADGVNIRISGEDVMRGTFAHRHAAVVDQITDKRYYYYKSMSSGGARFDVYNSILSEYGVMGFDYGYSMHNPHDLVIWEGQFGDFANGAQIIIDQFISGAEQKWGRLTNFVLMLPHGYEGQGPEHSSARIERFLQLAAQYNMRIINPTTPANLFHALRRQVLHPVKKPLVIFTPKSLLRHKLAVSDLNEFIGDTEFKHLIFNKQVDKDSKRLILCSGKVYYDLIEKIEELKTSDTVVVKVEQLYPFPKDEILRLVSDFTKSANKSEVIWCQDEPKNMGAYAFVKEILSDWLFENRIKMIYRGRDASASVATGSTYEHGHEQKKLIESCFDLA
jgi:2-oxoglutarate dehydrogenase E1 component